MSRLTFRGFRRDEEGQSLLIIAGVFAVILGSVAFAVDQGYGFAQRRAMENASQSGSLAAGRMLAESVYVTDDGALFGPTREEVFQRACEYAIQNIGTAMSAPTYTLNVEFLRVNLSDLTSTTLATVSGTITSSASSCTKLTATAIPLLTDIASYTMDIRVSLTTSYPTFTAPVIGSPSAAAAGVGRSRILGGTFSTADLDPWPMVRHYNADDFAYGNCGNPCNPDTATPFTFWGNETFGSFKGLVNFSRYSPAWTKEGAGTIAAEQLIKEWDKTGSASASPATTPKADKSQSGGCGGPWDTMGTALSAGTQAFNTADSCSIPNWAYYGLGGDLSLDKDWQAAYGTSGSPYTSATDEARRRPTLLGTSSAPTAAGARATVCGNVPDGLSVPSCANGKLGDWVETSQGNLGNNIAQALSAAIADRGTTDELYAKYGKVMVVLVFLWDCAEEYTFKTTPPKPSWTLINNSKASGTAKNTDCSDTLNWQGNPTPNRVHLVAAVPFRFYAGLVSSSQIQGFWGGVFASPSSCPSQRCAISPFANTTALVGND